MQSKFISTQLFNFLQPLQHKYSWKHFYVGRLDQHIVIGLNRLGGMKSCLKFLRSLVTSLHFTGQNWISKSVYCCCEFMQKVALSNFINP